MLSYAGDTKKLPETSDVFEHRLTDKVWDDQHFQRCIHMEKGTLFLHGAPGLGKTTTATRIVHRLLERRAEISVAYRFFEFEDSPSQHSADKIAMRLLLQICGEIGNFPACVCELYEVRDSREITLQTIESTLTAVIKENNKDCVIVLDAMDECRNGAALESLLGALFRIQNATRIGIIATDRRDRRKDPRCMPFASLESLELHSMSEDMEAYVTRRLKSNALLLQDGNDVEQKRFVEACDSILGSSEGL
jgi:Cdc6-like AAA superfamily ATPase